MWRPSTFSDISLANASGSDGKLYAVPKDKDTVGLVYNKEMFDAAGRGLPRRELDLGRPGATPPRRSTDATGKYGYMAYGDDQLGYWNFVYQAGGSILTEDNTRANYTDPATKLGHGVLHRPAEDYDWCPDQNYFAETGSRHRLLLREGRHVL